MPVSERIKIIIDTFEGGTVLKFAKKIGVAHTSVAAMLPGNRESKPGFDLINKILEAYPTISAEWLIQGEGKMLKDSRIVDKETIIHTSGEIPEEAIPLYDIEISAGNVSRLIEDNNNVPVVGWIQLEELPNKSGFLGVRAKGKSMASFIDSGDMLIIRPITNRRFVPLGEAYVIITEEQSVTKYIRAGSTKDTYTLRSHNYTMFEDFEVYKADIKHLFLVVKVIKDVTY